MPHKQKLLLYGYCRFSIALKKAIKTSANCDDFDGFFNLFQCQLD